MNCIKSMIINCVVVIFGLRIGCQSMLINIARDMCVLLLPTQNASARITRSNVRRTWNIETKCKMKYVNHTIWTISRVLLARFVTFSFIVITDKHEIQHTTKSAQEKHSTSSMVIDIMEFSVDFLIQLLIDIQLNSNSSMAKDEGANANQPFRSIKINAGRQFHAVQRSVRTVHVWFCAADKTN